MAAFSLFLMLHKCIICSTAWGQKQNWSESVEKPVLLPCGSVIGKECIADHFHMGSEENDETDGRLCPHCQQKLWYSQCGHSVTLRPLTIKGHDIAIPQRGPLPHVTSAAEMPANCPLCAVRLLPTFRRLEALKVERERLASLPETRRLTRARAERRKKDLASCEEEIELVQGAFVLECMGLEEIRKGW